MTFTWNQVRDVVDEVLELPCEQRASYLDRACPQPQLRNYVESLILAYDRAGSFLESPALGALPDPLAPAGEADESWVGRRLGAYELIEEIGEGGMGKVYRAVRADDQYQKQVAIKVIKEGLETALAQARFRAERQILANLEHPNIARLLDGGTTDHGLPYLVMELVQGLPIDEYCNSHKLSIADRLGLFRSVCSAVEYAHQNLVVHRDLKPANILITKQGTPKLLDFGIAKMLNPEPSSRANELSIAFLRILTPEYASPEQITSGDVSTSTDVYSLGVVLYILLTGHRPYQVDVRRPEEMARTICEVEPQRPSLKIRETEQVAKGDGTSVAVNPEGVSSARGTKPERLHRQLRGDLDNIALMALRKDPQRRYASVEQFSEDIRRHLEGLPVRARQETLGYRTQRFVTRNKLAVGVIALLLLSLSAGLVATLHEARIARAQQAKADRRFQDVRELANSLMFEVHDGIVNLPGSTPVRKRLVERALKYLDSLSKEAKGDRSLEMELATAYDKIGDVQGQPNEANLGDPAAATASYLKALAMRESLASENPEDARLLRELVTSYIRLSDLLWSRGDRTQSLENARKEIPAGQKLFRTDPSNWQNRLLLAMCHVDQGYKEGMLGEDRSRGVATLGQGTAMLEQMLAEKPEDLSLRRRLGLSYGRMGEIQRFGSQNYAAALPSFQKAVSTLQPLLAADLHNAEIRRLIAYDQFVIGQLQAGMNQTVAALAQEREALASFEELAAADPANAQLSQDLGRVHGDIGELLTKSGDVQKAIPELQQSLALLGKTADGNNPVTLSGYAVMLDRFWLGMAHMKLAAAGKHSSSLDAAQCRKAKLWFDLSLSQYELLIRRDPKSSGASETMKEIREQLARCGLTAH